MFIGLHFTLLLGFDHYVFRVHNSFYYMNDYFQSIALATIKKVGSLKRLKQRILDFLWSEGKPRSDHYIARRLEGPIYKLLKEMEREGKLHSYRSGRHTMYEPVVELHIE